MNTRFGIIAAFATAAFAAVGASAQEASTADRRAQASGEQLYASPSQVRLVQEKLREQGRKPGQDGAWDEATVAEVRDYQKANGLAPTGQLDTSLLSALEIGDVLEGETSSRFLDGLLRADRPGSSGDERTSGRGAPLYVSPVHVAQIQHLLREQGHYEGQIDGVWGEATARAANEFRKAQSLEANAGLDIALLRALNALRSDVPKLASASTSHTEGVPLQAGPVAIRALQRELADQGHEAGAIDGVWGENTRQALRDFQREHDLESTGTLTLPTLAALGIDVAGRKGAATSEPSGFEARSRTEGAAEPDEEPDAVATTEQEE
jgi:peptidoglycan hydrolase-like protein with peptidoglycan-binding domain